MKACWGSCVLVLCSLREFGGFSSPWLCVLRGLISLWVGVTGVRWPLGV